MDTPILFFILAGLLAVILIGHSIWSSRREKSQMFKADKTFGNSTISIDKTTVRLDSEPMQFQSDIPQHANREQEIRTVENITISLPEREVKPNLSVETQPVDEQPIEVAMPKVRIDGFYPSPIQTEASYPHHEIPNAPLSSDDENIPQPIQINLASTSQIDRVEMESNHEVSEQYVSENTEEDNSLFMLYVVASEQHYFNGETVAQQLYNLGLQLGSDQMFHRHIDTVSSPIIFSVANMMDPGQFDVNHLHEQLLVGVIFYMELPSQGNNIANMRLMIRTAESLAQSLGGFVLDDQRRIFNDDSRTVYLKRVEKFK